MISHMAIMYEIMWGQIKIMIPAMIASIPASIPLMAMSGIFNSFQVIETHPGDRSGSRPFE